MDALGNKGDEEGGLWLAKKAGEGDTEITGRGEETQSCQAAVSGLPNCSTKDDAAGEALAKPTRDGLVQSADGLPQETFKICKEYLRPYKRCLRKLHLPKDLPEEKRMNCTRKNLLILGDHINLFLQHYCKAWELKHWKKMLWRFVALFSIHDEKQLWKLYRYSKDNEMDKFLKTYARLEYPTLLTRPKESGLMKLREKWGLPGDLSMPEKLKERRSLSPGLGQPKGGVSKKRLRRAASSAGRQDGVELTFNVSVRSAFARSDGLERFQNPPLD
ncbi:hypothetical protein JRQ81_008141 [Phrynocephalus forsythii]|uniref:Chromodomain-helicase-DNA-binding protein 1-like C-terminal domain-containing protein n=1 Tax=Phrynocephalus forsythii TaxID=171643 RepID=A0A9Q0XD93_9SAUR|nr:hypothetical protein JRQ81_008141 [Phrynocephalus forsythii]